MWFFQRARFGMLLRGCAQRASSSVLLSWRFFLRASSRPRLRWGGGGGKTWKVLYQSPVRVEVYCVSVSFSTLCAAFWDFALFVAAESPCPRAAKLSSANWNPARMDNWLRGDFAVCICVVPSGADCSVVSRWPAPETRVQSTRIMEGFVFITAWVLYSSSKGSR